MKYFNIDNNHEILSMIIMNLIESYYFGDIPNCQTFILKSRAYPSSAFSV